MSIKASEVATRLKEGKEVWFFMLGYSGMTYQVHKNVPPARVGSITDSREYISPLGKRGKPLSKEYRVNYHSTDLMFYVTEKECIQGYNNYLKKCRDDIEAKRVSSNNYYLDNLAYIDSITQ